MKKNKIILVVMGVLLIVFIFYFINVNKKEYNNDLNVLNSSYKEVDGNDIGYQENISIEDLKKETSITGNDEIYEIQKEYDGRKVLVVKPSFKYSVAFTGAMKKALPKMDELDQVLNDNLPQNNGIWVEESSRSRVLELFNKSNNTESSYCVNEEGYLEIEEKNSQSDIDRKIENVINGDRQFILDVSSVCYIIDDVTGEILDYNFENLDRYQTYEYFEDDGKFIVFITQNSYNQLDDGEIFDSIVRLF